ncbi:unnamed protein product [Rotaria sp. Silwood2]|nr:unnamed protein product [Rotaria sp. Silwood2]CAF4043061.1 unnamed protein product [Rotaria sp. Silwood2]
MGAKESRETFYAIQQDQQTTMKQNTAIAKRFADNQETIKPQHEADVTQMAKFVLVLIDTQTNTTKIREEKKEVDIEGTTYEMVEFISRGGFGEIHKAKVKNKNVMVAIKIMESKLSIQEEIKNEINFLRLMKQVPIDNHPVIEFYGSKIDREGIYIAMELASCDLGTFWCHRVSNETVEHLVIIGIIIIVYVLRALTFLEKLNIIHGDIKPQNIVIVANEECFHIKLIDFGTIEKMNTQRMQLTVDANKAYTIFFVSPEFLKRDSKNLVSRHLHKKSDAWAAGVLFYLLFCGALPWKDQFEYENFCNDRSAKDIIIPEEGGYKMIIELLLKKNPEERSSAKETLMQLKAHPIFGSIVETLHEKFCSVDDVCHMIVPDDVQQGIGKPITESVNFTKFRKHFCFCVCLFIEKYNYECTVYEQK